MKVINEQRRTTKIVVVVNGSYGEALVEAAEVVVGGLGLEVVEVPCLEESSDRREFIAGRIRRSGGPGDVLLLTDLLGSTPANVCLSLVINNEGWEVLTGLNLPMLMKLATCDPTSRAADLARQLCDSSQRCCRLGSEILREDCRGD